MWRGLYTAAAGMMTETKRTDVISNNLANADAKGFKRDVAVNKEFEPMLIRRINDYDPRMDVTAFKGFHLGSSAPKVGTLGRGSFIDEIAVDAEQGSFESTGNPWDLAISGDGFFAVQTPQGVRYTRDGAFFRSSTGQLQNVKGLPVLNRQGQPITIPPNTVNISVGARGEIFADGAQVAELMFVSFGDDRKSIQKQGDNLWNPAPQAVVRQATGTIEQGALERSNSNTVMEMVELINNYRVYEAGSKAVITQDAMLDKSVNEVGRQS